MAVVSTLAVPLRSFAYGETSRVIRFYTREAGVLGVVARGVRKGGSKGRAEPGTFARGTLTAYVKESRELQTFKDFSPDRPRRGLGVDPVRFSSASVLGEIVLRHAGEEGNSSFFDALDAALDAVERSEGTERLPELLVQAWKMVTLLGYRPVVTECISCGEVLDEDALCRFDLSAGGSRCERCADAFLRAAAGSEGSAGEGRRRSGPRLGPGARVQLEALLEGAAPSDLRKPRAHLRLLEGFVTHHLSEGRPFRSFRILEDLVAAEGS